MHIQLKITHPKIKVYQLHTTTIKHHYGLEIFMIIFGIWLYWIFQDACKEADFHSYI